MKNLYLIILIPLMLSCEREKQSTLQQALIGNYFTVKQIKGSAYTIPEHWNGAVKEINYHFSLEVAVMEIVSNEDIYNSVRPYSTDGDKIYLMGVSGDFIEFKIDLITAEALFYSRNGVEFALVKYE